ncbi:MAG: hypothetical protein R6U17_09950 [Thermoplasmata archaeon]
MRESASVDTMGKSLSSRYRLVLSKEFPMSIPRALKLSPITEYSDPCFEKSRLEHDEVEK